jgi:lipopolysaccharide/colanic/teichoic acid biosynthesis glycosyltransferase
MIQRLFDVLIALLLLTVLGLFLLICLLIASFDTQSFGLFQQKRIGQKGIPFTIFKIKTIKDRSDVPTRFGRLLRKYKIDEVPQLRNILMGTMTFVGPRPDVPGYADLIEGDARAILALKPGITSLAALKYRNEEALLAQQPNPQVYNDTVIWPDKIRINKWYLQNRSFAMDVKIIIYTLYPSNFDVDQYINSHPQS